VANKKDKVDPLKFDQDLDFDNFMNDDEIMGGINPEARQTKKRSVVTDVFSGTISGASSALKDPNFIKKVADNSLPREYGFIGGEISKVASTAAGLYDETVKELKPQLSKITAKLDKLIPQDSPRLKKASSKLAGIFNEGTSSSSSGPSKEQVQDQNINQTLADIFTVQQENLDQKDKKEQLAHVTREKMEHKRFQSNYGLLTSIDQNMAKLTGYTEKVNQAFQKKSLELQYRSYFVQSELLNTSTKFFEVFKAQYDVIAKNTAMPEYIKINESERFKQHMKQKFVEGTTEGLFGKDSAIGKLMNKAKKDAGEYLKGVKQGIEMAIQGLDGVEQLNEMSASMAGMGIDGPSKAEMGGTMLGGVLMDKLGSLFEDHVGKHIKNKKEVKDFGFRTAADLKDLPAFMKKKMKEGNWRDTADGATDANMFKKMLAKAGVYIAESMQGGRADMSIDNPNGMSGLGEASVFDKKTQISIVEVIPGYLSHILRELTISRTGNEKAELSVYDHNRGRFVSQKNMRNLIKVSMASEMKKSSFGYSADTAVKSIMGDTALDKAAEREVKGFLAKLSRKEDGFSYTKDSILSTEEFNQLSPKVKELLRDKFTEGMDGEDKEEFNYNVISSMKDLKTSNADIRPMIERYVRNGQAAELEKMGVIKFDKKANRYDINEAKYYDFMDKHTLGRETVPSDEMIKEDIKPLGPRRALSALSKINVFSWKYKKGQGDGSDDTKHGPMAQDVKEHMGEDAAPGGKKIDLTTMNGNLMQAVKELHKEQQQHLKSGESTKLLKAIVKNTATSNKLLVHLIKRGGAGSGGSGGSPEGDDSVGGLLGNVVGSSAKLAGKAAGGAVDLATGVAKGTTKVMSDIYTNHKDIVYAGTKKLLGTGFDIMNKTLSFSSDVLFQHMPKMLGKASDLFKDAKNALFGSVKDIYVHGVTSPKLQAALMRTGQYKDSVTGKIIESVDDIKNIKGHIVNQAGEVCLTLEEAAQGIYDQYGEKIRTGISKGVAFAAGMVGMGLRLGGKVLGKMPQAFKNLGGMVKWAGGKLGGAVSRITGNGDAIAEQMANFKEGILGTLGSLSGTMGGFGGHGEKIYDVLCEIRGVMRGEDPPRHEEKKDFAKNFIGPMLPGMQDSAKAAVSSKLSGIKEKGKGLMSGAKSWFNSVTGRDIVTGPELPAGFQREGEQKLSLMDKAKGMLGLNKEKAPELMGPPKPKVIKGNPDPNAQPKQGLFKRFLSVTKDDKDHISKMFENKRDLDKNFVGPMPQAMSVKLLWEIRETLTKAFGKGKEKGTLVDALSVTGGEGSGPAEEAEVEETTPQQEPDQEAGNGKGGIFDSMLNMGKTAISKGKDMFSGAATGIAAGKGKWGKIGGGITGALGGLFGSNKKAEPEEEPEKKEEKKEEKKSQSEKIAPQGKAAKKAAKKARGRARGKGKGEFNDRDGDGRRDGNFQERLEKEEAAEAARKSENKAALPGGRWNSGKALDGLMKKASGMMDMISGRTTGIMGAIQGVTSLASDYIMGKATGKAVETVAAKGGQAAATTAAASTAAAGTTAAATVGKASKLGGFLGKKGLARLIPGLGVAYGGYSAVDNLQQGNYGMAAVDAGITAVSLVGFKAALGAAGTVLAGIGALISAPVLIGAAVLGGIGAAVYFGYKYLTRNDADEYEDIRLKQYGIGTGKADKDFNKFIFKLEDYLLDGRIGYSSTGEAYIQPGKAKAEEMLSLFEIDKKDVEKGRAFGKWFGHRFKPFFLHHLTTLFSIDKKASLGDVKKLKLEDRVSYLNKVGFESGPYDIHISPFKGHEHLNVDKTFALNAIKVLLEKLQKGKKEEAKKAVPPALPPKEEPPKAPGAGSDKTPSDTPKPPTPSADKGNTAAKAANQESGEGDGPQAAKADAAATKVGTASAGAVSPKLYVADGSLRDGSGADQYIEYHDGANLRGVNPQLLNLVKGMVQEYGELTGKKVVITDGFRTREQQAAAYAKDNKKAAKPGNSLHEFGLAVDIDSAALNKMEKMGLMRKYGLTRPITGEDWHVEAALMQTTSTTNLKKDPNLASTLIAGSPGKGGGGIGSLGKDKNARKVRNPSFAMASINGSATNVAPKTDKDVAKATLALNKPKPQVNDPYGLGTPTSSTSNQLAQRGGAVPLTKEEMSAKAPSTSKGSQTAQRGSKLPGSNGLSPSVMLASSNDYSKNNDLPHETDPGKVEPSDGAGNTSDIPIVNPGNKEEVKKVVQLIAAKHNEDPNMMAAFAAQESSLNPNARASQGSATGLFQFTDITWKEVITKKGRKHGLDHTASRNDIHASTLMAIEYMKQNKRSLSSVKKDLNITDMYLTHFLGAEGARQFLKADPGSIGADVMPKAARANKAIFYENGRPLTMSEIYNKITNKLTNTAKAFGIQLPNIKGLPQGQVTTVASNAPAANSPTMTNASYQAPAAVRRGESQASNPSMTGGSTVNERARPSGVFSQGAPNVLSSPDSAMSKSSGTSTDSFTRATGILDKQLTVQQEMLDVLKKILEKTDPETVVNALKGMTTDAGRTPQGNQPRPAAITPSVNLNRKVA
jgi:hypothetical protein